MLFVLLIKREKYWIMEQEKINSLNKELENLKKIIALEEDAIAAYSNIRTQKNIQMTWIIQSLYAMFSNSRGFMKILLDGGMKFLDSTPKIKNKIIEFANKN